MAELERAGVGLVLAAEAAGRLREQHRFLYAAAEDLRVADVPLLLSGYKVRVSAWPSSAWDALRDAAVQSDQYATSVHDAVTSLSSAYQEQDEWLFVAVPNCCWCQSMRSTRPRDMMH